MLIMELFSDGCESTVDLTQNICFDTIILNRLLMVIVLNVVIIQIVYCCIGQ